MYRQYHYRTLESWIKSGIHIEQEIEMWNKTFGSSYEVSMIIVDTDLYIIEVF